MQSIQLMLADTPSMMLDGLKLLLESERNFHVIAQTDHLEDCLEKMMQYNPDLLILNIDLPDYEGLKILKEINTLDRKIKILILTERLEIKNLILAVEIGIDGYLTKQSKFIELKQAIFSLMKGEVYIDQQVLYQMRMQRDRIENDCKKLERLTKRELDVLKNLSIGMYNKEIATKLEISERTVKNHIFSIFKKLSVADRTQAALFAIRCGVVDLYGE